MTAIAAEDPFLEGTLTDFLIFHWIRIAAFCSVGVTASPEVVSNIPLGNLL